MTSEAQPSRRIRIIEIAAVVIVGLVLFFLRFGSKVLDPGQVDWLLARNDPASYYLIWDYFRYESWSFPLGQITQYLYPLGTSVPLTDGLPLVAYPAKLLSPILPPVFQYFGFWHLVCAVLQAYFGYRIVRRVFMGSALRILGATLFMLAPVFLYREGHIALSSHWVILAAIEVYLIGDRGRWRQVARRWCILIAVVALIHPYLLAMVLLFFAGLVLQSNNSGLWPWRGRLITAGCVGATILVVWYIAGYLAGASAERAGTTGFGIFSLNLNALINPMGYGKILDSMPRGRGQYEGFAYLGAGWLLMIAAGAGALVFWRDLRERMRPHKVLVWIMIVTFLYALSNVVMWSDVKVLSYKRFAIFDLITGVFRCSGRFVWPIIYIGMTGVIILLGRIRFRWAVVAVMTVALVLQVWDMRPLIFQKDHFAKMEFETRLSDPNWNKAAEFCAGISTMPPFKFTMNHKADYRDICWLASQHRLRTSAGYTARMSLAAKALTDSMHTALAEGTADTTLLYICDRSSFPKVLVGLGDSYRGALWNDYHVCYPRAWPMEPRPGFTASHGGTLAEFLDDRTDRILLIATRDEATANLTKADRLALRQLGIMDSAIEYRGSAAAIVFHGQAIWQQAKANGRVEFTLAAGDSMGGIHATHAIRVVSAGFESGNVARLELGDREEGMNRRGFNILVLDDELKLLESAWFDTHKGVPGIILMPDPPN